MKKTHIIAILIIAAVAILAVVYFAKDASYLNISSKNLTEGTGLAEEMEIIELNDGDTFDLKASIVKKVVAGNEIKMLAYNGSIPGPVIKVEKGSEITVNFTNNTDVPTTIHSHGLRLENKYDGVPDVTQKEIKVGQTFTYKMKFPDEGVYWYHPHIREDYAQELGLYGNYIVVSDDPNYWNKVNREVPIMVDDILLDNGKPAPFGKVADHALMGRYGNVMLTNGEDDYKLSLKRGETVRFYFTNTANTRTFNLTVPEVKMKVVGGDNGRYEKEFYSGSVIISPSERVVVEAHFPKSGKYELIHKTPNKQYVMGVLDVSEETVDDSFVNDFNKLRVNNDIRKEIPNIDSYFSKKADKNLKMTVTMQNMGMMGEGMHMMPDGTMMNNAGMMRGTGSEKIEWEDDMAMMNSMSLASQVKWKLVDTDTTKENMHINDWKFKIGDLVKVKIFNDPKSLHPMQHPLHFHGQRFLILTTNGVKNTNLVWKDTALIQKGDTVEILLEMKNPGVWMAHCHIAEHLESGMMFNFEVK